MCQGHNRVENQYNCLSFERYQFQDLQDPETLSHKRAEFIQHELSGISLGNTE